MEEGVRMLSNKELYNHTLGLLYGCMDRISDEERNCMVAILPRDKDSILSGYLVNELCREKPQESGLPPYYCRGHAGIPGPQ